MLTKVTKITVIYDSCLIADTLENYYLNVKINCQKMFWDKNFRKKFQFLANFGKKWQFLAFIKSNCKFLAILFPEGQFDSVMTYPWVTSSVLPMDCCKARAKASSSFCKNKQSHNSIFYVKARTSWWLQL